METTEVEVKPIRSLAADIGHEPSIHLCRAMPFLRRCSNQEIAWLCRDGLRRIRQERPVVILDAETLP